jgi:subfamily B ATP-binding cassette protein MsbA
MKTYFRLLSFAKPIQKFAIPYILTTLLTVIFSTLNLALLAPLLQTLFSGKGSTVQPLGVKPSFFDIMGTFRYYVNYAINNYGAWAALQFVCATIIVAALLSNLFRYLSQRTMESLRVHTLLNLRRTVFNNVMNLHMGYFSNERKGDIISKIASDVQVVQYSVTGTLQVVFKEPLTLIAFLVMLFLISPSLTLYSLIVIPLSALIISRIVKRLKEQATASQQTYGNMISYLDEALSGIKIIKAFNATAFIKNRFDKENIKYSAITRAMAKRQQLASPVSEFFGGSYGCRYCIVWWPFSFK